ncbi:MAG: hypothetical protein Q9201_005286 [Fulgogasparrea decipioides]
MDAYPPMVPQASAVDIGIDPNLVQAQAVMARQNAVANRLTGTADVWNKIIDLAMKADYQYIVVTGDNVDRPNPNVATGLLRINHELYHRCRDIMYSENIIVIDETGAGFEYLGQKLGLHYCGEFCCACAHIGSLHIIIGCDDYDFEGIVKTEAMIQAIKQLPRSIVVQHLRIDLKPFCFANDRDLALFVDVLKDKIGVEQVFELTGLDVHWGLDLRTIPTALEMKLQPLHCDFEPHNDKWQTAGFFGCSYEPAKTENEKLGRDATGKEIEIKDAKYYYDIHEAELYHGTAIGY